MKRSVAVVVGIALVASALTASEVTATTAQAAPRTTVIAWADCNYGLETLPTPPLAAYSLTPDGVVMRSFDNGRTESAVIGPKRFRTIAEGIDHSTLFDPPPEPSPDANGYRVIGRTISDTRNTRFAVRRDGEWTDWIFYRDYTKSEEAAVDAAYAVAYDTKLVWHPAAPRANAFAVCDWGAPREAMIVPASPTTSKWGVAEIVVVDCHRGTENSPARPVYAYRLMRTGNVARTTADDDGSRVARRTENFSIGFTTMADLRVRLEQSGFFEDQGTSADAAGTDTTGMLLSALRDDRRATWSSERSSSRQTYSDFIAAILAKVSDPGSLWTPGLRDDKVFSMCTR